MRGLALFSVAPEKLSVSRPEPLPVPPLVGATVDVMVPEKLTESPPVARLAPLKAETDQAFAVLEPSAEPAPF